MSYDDMMESLREYWGNLRSPEDFFTPPLPAQPISVIAARPFFEALCNLAKYTAFVIPHRIEHARKELFETLRRRAVDERKDIISNDITVHDIVETWQRVKREKEEQDAFELAYENEAQDGHETVNIPGDDRRRRSRSFELDERDNGRRSRDGVRHLRREDRRSRSRVPMDRSPRRYRQRSRNQPHPRGHESRTRSIDEPPIPPSQPPIRSATRAIAHPLHYGSSDNHLSEYAIDMPSLSAQPPGASFDEQVELRDGAMQLFAAQEQYYEAVRRKLLARYEARVQMYEKNVIQIQKRVAGGEGSRYERDDERRDRIFRGHGRESRDGRRR